MALLKVNDDGTIGVNKKKKKKSQADLIVGSDGKISFNSEKYEPEEEDIAPVRTDTERSWFKSGLFEDGWDFGDVTKTILGTNKDLADDLAAGVAGIGEGLIDTGAYVAGGLSKLIGADDFSEKMKKFQERDLVKEYNIADRLVDTVSPGGKIIGIANDILNKGDAEKVSILGEKTDSLVQSAGQLAGTGALQMVGVPWWLTTGVTSFGSGTEQAFQNDATYGEAGAYGLISAGAEVLLEKLSGGIKFGGKALDEGLKRKLTEGITNKTVNTLAKLGFDMAGEGTEEVLTEVITNIGEKLTFADEKTWSELLTSEEAVDGYIESFIGGAVLGGGFSAGKAYKSAKTGRDYDTGLTNNEQSVVNAEVTNRSAEIQKQRAVKQQIDRIIEERERTFGNLSDAEKKSIAQQVQTRLESGELDFTKTQLSKKEIAKIESEVMEDLKKGYIGIDTIENTLSGTKTAHLRELEQSLTNTTNEAKKAEIEAEINQIKGDRANELKSLLSKDVLLQESYRQEALRGQEFTREVTEADSDITKELIESAKSSKMNNTRKMHDLFEYTNKIANDTNTKYGFTNNEQLKELGHNLEGRVVNGLVRTNKDGSIKVLINVDSEKAINTIIGHETTHLLEGTNEYKALQNIVKEYATTKGEYDRRFKELSELYKGVNANIENEITADLVGDYLFTDEQFVNNLSAKEPNVFQKVYDFIKHAYKMATAGSKEARQLEQVKRKFDQSYKQMKKTTAADSDVKYSVSYQSQGGYDGKKMSNRAVEAYEGGEKPLSKWNKTALIEAIEDAAIENDVEISSDVLQKLTVKELQENFLNNSSWHHTGAFYNKTDFYKLNEDAVIQFNESKADEIINNRLPARKLTEAERNAKQEAKSVLEEAKGIYDQLDVIFNSGITGLSTFKGIEARWESGNLNLEETYQQALNAIKEKDSSKIKQWEALPEGHWRKEDVELFNNDLPEYARKYYLSQNARKKTILEQIKKNISDPISDSNIRFSLSAPVEEARDLMAIHNLRANEVLKQLDLGGMPMPSIAITNPDIVNHTDFGEVSLIMKKEAIDPKKSKYNKVYSRDAYTPTFPRIDYEADRQVAERIIEKVKTLYNDVPEFYQKNLKSLRDKTNIDEILNREGGEQNFIEKNLKDYGVKQLYLAEKGQVVPVVIKRTEKEITDYQKETHQYVIEKLGKEIVLQSKAPGVSGREWYANYGEQIKDAYYDLFIKDGFSKEDARDIVDSEKGLYWTSRAREAADFINTGGKTIEENPDFAATNKQIDEAIAGSDFEQWTKSLFKGIEGLSGIRNNKDTFTPSGKRRGFKELHDPVTLEKVVKAMRGDEAQIGQGAMGLGNMKGASAKEYRSIKDLKDDSGKIGTLTKEENKANEDYISDRLFEIAQEYANGKDIIDARNALVEAVANYESRAGIKNYLKQFDYVYNLKESIVDNIIELRDFVRNLPTPYFESKPRRAVGFDEVGVFVIPNNADATLKQKLLESGYAIAEYNPEIEGDRQNVVNRFEEYKFSLSKPGEDIAPIGNYNVYGKDVKLQEDIVPVKETISETETVEDVAPVREDLQLSRALTEDDLPYVEQDREDAFNNLPEYVPEEIEYYNEPDTVPLDDKYLRLVAKNMRQELSLKNNQVAGLRKIIQDFSTSEDQSIESLYNAIESEFGTIYEKQKIDDITGIKAALRSTRLKVSDVIKTDIPDYAKWKQKQFGTLRITNDGMAVDDVYEGLKDIYPQYFPEDIINPTDQLLKIAEIASMDATVIEEYSLPEEQIQEVTDYIYESISEYKQQKRFEAGQTASTAPIDESMIPYEETVLETPIPEDAIPVKKESEPETEPETEEAPLIAKTRKEIRKALLEDNHDIIVAAMENAKNLASPLMNNTDTIRLSEMVFGREAGNKINELIFQKVLDNEAKSVAWQNKQRKAIKNLGIKARSKESAAVQKWGEGEYVDEFGDLREYTDSDLMLEFPDIEVQNKIKNAAIEIRRRYDEYIDLSNQVLTGLGFPPIEKRKNYFMHFQELGDFFSKNGIPFNPQSMSENNLPTDINGLTEFFVPQKKFFASMRRREGKRTVYDAITGIDKYISGVADLIYHTEDIQRGRAFEELIRDTYGQNDAAKANREALPEELRPGRLEKQQTAHLSKYVRWLHNWTDNLAGKKNRIDRAIEDLGDRAGFSVLDTARKQVSANMIGFNPASALTNVIASVQAISKTDKAAVAKGTADTIRNIIQKDDFASKNSFLINRFGTDMLSKNMWQKIQDAGFVFMKGMDWFSSNQIVRSKFYELKAQGMTDAEAHAEAGKFAARIMGDRTKGANAMFFNSKLFNTIGQFQLEVNNQLYSIFYDTYQESKEKAKEDSLKTAAGMTFTLGQMFAFTHLFGKTFESVAGYNPTFDVFGIIATALGLGDDEEEDVVDNLQEAAEQLLKALPYSSLFTDGGRIPLASAVPDIGGLITGGKDEYGNDLEFLKEAAKLPYLFLPAGYGQIKKTTQGLGMFSEDLPVTGSYTDSGNLRFPVEDTPLNRLQAGIFGQWSNSNARDYFDNERKPLGEKQIQEYKDLDIPIKDYWQYREDLKDHKTLEDKFDYIADLDIPVSKKNIMINNIVDRKEAVDMANYDQFASYEEFDWATKNPEKYSYLESIGVSYKQYNASDEAKDAYNWAYKNPEKYGLAKAAAGDVVTYRSYTSALNDLTADKDSNGKTISGSRKTKVADYINSLDADYGSKLILFKSEYPSDDTYNNEIIEYLNNRQDISYDEMVAILTELEFTVRDDGYVTW